MLCDICHKREATIHITEIINDEAKELHVCSKCAETESIHMQQSFGIADLLSGLAEFPSLIEEEKVLKCPTCGMTYSDFRKIGRLGCSDCYKAFSKVLLPLLKNIHGSSQYVGKEPERIQKAVSVDKEQMPKKTKVATKEERLTDLRQRLQKAIQAEAYEEAAAIRDRIRELEKDTK